MLPLIEAVIIWVICSASVIPMYIAAMELLTNRSEKPELINSTLYHGSIPPFLEMMSFSYSFQRNSIAPGGELITVLTKPVPWNAICPVLASVLPFIRIRQCRNENGVFDFDLEDSIPIPPNTPLSTHSTPYMIVNTTMEWSHLPWMMKIPSLNQSRWKVELKKENEWTLRILQWKEPCILTKGETNPHSGFHHTIHLSIHSNHSSIIALFFPREIIINKDELRSLSSFPPFLATDPSSSVELISEESHPQILFLFCQQPSVDLPIHLRYARASIETIHRVTVPPAVVYNLIDVFIHCLLTFQNQWIPVETIAIGSFQIPVGDIRDQTFVSSVTFIVLMVATTILLREILPFPVSYATNKQSYPYTTSRDVST